MNSATTWGWGHDAREEEAPVGTFDWSRGHGVDGLFATIMAYETGYNYVGPDIQYFSNPEIACNGQPCGVDKSDLSLGADAALSIRTTMYQVSQLTAGVVDSDNDGSDDEFDNCPNDVNRDQLDTDQDGQGDACDSDDDGDGVPDASDAFPLDTNETTDTDGDGFGNNADTDDDGDGVSDDEDAFPLDPTRSGNTSGVITGMVFLQTTSTSQNVSLTHVINSSEESQRFTGTLYNSAGESVGGENQSLHIGAISPNGRLILSSETLETAFDIPPWRGPALLEVKGTASFELMTKLTSPSGLVSNTNCVRRDQVHNIEGADSPNMSYIRLINIGTTTLSSIRGTIYDGNGEVIGNGSQTLVSSLAPKQQVWINRDDLFDIVDDNWNGEAMLKIESPSDTLRLLNLNYINSETFFNFSCYEAGQ